MGDQMLSWGKKDHILVIQMRRAGKKAELQRLAGEFADLCGEIKQDERARVIVLCGAEEDSFRMEADSPLSFASLTEPVAAIDQPVLAAIRGDAAGLGLELALACDLRIATKTSRFSLPHIQKGLIPWEGGTQRLSRLVGKGKALEMILTGESIDADEAYRIGLLNRVVPPSELMLATMETAKGMAAKGPMALQYVKEAVYQGMDMTLAQGLRLEGDLYFLLHTTKDRSEGVSAFRQKKTPRFEGK